jgi:hypothetical protein
MNYEVIPYLQHLPESSRVDFLRKLEAQLVKDLYPVHWELISADLSPSTLVSQLHSAISTLIHEHAGSLGQVLYRIDIPEGRIRNLMASTAPESRVSVLASEILEREAKKVWLRIRYSQKHDS